MILRLLPSVFILAFLFQLNRNPSPSPASEVCPMVVAEQAPEDTSYLSTPLVIPTQLIEDKINTAIRQDLINDNDFDNDLKKSGHRDHVKMQVRRLGNIQLRWKNNTATCTVPLGILVERRLINLSKLIPTDKIASKLDFALQLTFDIDVEVNEDWRLVTDVRFKEMSWLSDAKVLWGTVNLKKPVQKRLMAEMPNLEANIEQEIYHKVRLDRPVQKVWCKLQKPIALNKANKVIWLQFRPLSIELGRITTQGDNMLVETRIHATTKTLVGAQPVWSVDSVLPRLQIRRALPDTAQVVMRSELDMADLNVVLNQQLAGKAFEVKGRKINIEQVAVRGCGSDVVMSIQVNGDFNGTVHLRGQPHFEPSTQHISIRNFDYEMASSQFLIEGADWLLHSTFKDYAQSQLSLPLSEKLQQLPQRIERGIEQGKAGKKLDFDIQSWTFKPQSVVVEGGQLTTMVAADARVRIEIERL